MLNRNKYDRWRWYWKGKYWLVYDDYDDKVELDGFRIRFGKKFSGSVLWRWLKKYGIIVLFCMYLFRLIWNVYRYVRWM